MTIVIIFYSIVFCGLHLYTMGSFRKHPIIHFSVLREGYFLKNNPDFQSAAQFARRGIKSLAAICADIRNEIVPGFQTGNRFYINAPLYLAAIEAECLRNAGKEAKASDPN